MNNIPTAEEIYHKHTGKWFMEDSPLHKVIIEHTQLHVKAALQAADKKAKQKIPKGFWDYAEDKNFILNAYPLENIK